MLSTDLVKIAILKECEEDFVGLWSILWEVKNNLAIDNAQERRRITLRLIRELLDAGKIEVGLPANDGKSFTPWKIGVIEAMTRISSEWDASGPDPDIGEIAWFTSSPHTPVSPTPPS